MTDEERAKNIADPIIEKCKVNCAGENDWAGKYSGSFHSLFGAFRKKLRADIVEAIKEVRRESFEEAASIAENHTPSEKATEFLRCNPKDAQRPYIDSATMNGYDWACDDIAQAIRDINHKVNEDPKVSR